MVTSPGANPASPTSLLGVNVEVPVGQAVRLPNPPGAGGCLITNKDLTYSVDLAPTQGFVDQQTTTLPAGSPVNWPEGALWCRVTPGQVNVTGVKVYVQPGGGQALPGAISGLGYLGTFPPSSTALVVTPTPTTRSLIITNAPAGQIPSIVGDTSHVQLPSFALGDGYFVALMPAGPIDTSYQVLFGVDGSGANVWQSADANIVAGEVTIGGTVIVTPLSEPAALATVLNPAAGADWSLTLPSASRLLAITATLVGTGSVAPFLSLITTDFNYQMAPAAVTTTNQFTGFPTAPLQNSSYGGEERGTFPIPDMLLTAGGVIQSITVGISAAWQWQNIKLMLSPV